MMVVAQVMFLLLSLSMFCGQIVRVRTPEEDLDGIVIVDSLDELFWEVDVDHSTYWTVDEVIQSVRVAAAHPLTDAEALDKGIEYVRRVDANADAVLDIYEVRYRLCSLISNQNKVSGNGHIKEWDNHNDEDFVTWMQLWRGKVPQQYPFYLVKLYQIMDEDLNGKLTWKETTMIIKLAELHKSTDNKNWSALEYEYIEGILNGFKQKFGKQQQWKSLTEFESLLKELKVESLEGFCAWIVNFLGGNTLLESESVSEVIRKQFLKEDVDSSGYISKGELIVLLHQHRPGYYNEERINRKWTRADRNEDGRITFNEYLFLEEMKHPKKG